MAITEMGYFLIRVFAGEGWVFLKIILKLLSYLWTISEF